MVKSKRYFQDKDFLRQIADRIREIRTDNNHTQEYLIEKLHLSINSYETGAKIPTLMSILKLCVFYRITISEFFSPIKYPPKE